MKLFGNTGTRGVSRRDTTRTAPRVRSVSASAVAVAMREAPKTADVRRFRRGYWIYVLCMLVIIAAGLTYLWFRMDTYEKSLPQRAVETWMEARSAADWRSALTGAGVDAAFVDTLDLTDVRCYKKLDAWTDDAPAYTVSFGGKSLLTVTLRTGEALAFGKHGWEVGAVKAAPSGLAVFVPDGAAVTVDGAPVAADCLVRKNAQPLTLGPFEQGRDDIPGLDKYALDTVYTVDRVQVTDAEGSALAAAYSAGNAWYYPPLTSDVSVVAPASAAVTLNGVLLSEENAAAEAIAPDNSEYEMFSGIEDWLPFRCESLGRTAWTVQSLVAAPEVAAVMPDGTALQAEQSDALWDFPSPPAGKPDPDLKAELHDFLLDVFDAHIAYQGNRNKTIAANYSRYTAYLLPDSEAWDQTRRAYGSVEWAKGLGTHPDATLGEVLRYHADCFTAQVDYTPEGEPDGPVRSNIYVYVRSNGNWRVVRILNK